MYDRQIEIMTVYTFGYGILVDSMPFLMKHDFELPRYIKDSYFSFLHF